MKVTHIDPERIIKASTEDILESITRLSKAVDSLHKERQEFLKMMDRMVPHDGYWRRCGRECYRWSVGSSEMTEIREKG